MCGWISRVFGVTGPGSRCGRAVAPVEGPGCGTLGSAGPGGQICNGTGGAI